VRTCRFRHGVEERWGVVEEASAHGPARTQERGPAQGDLLRADPAGGQIVRALTAEPWAGGLPEGRPIRLSEVELLAPVRPSKVVCVGRNYQAHARELGNELPPQPLIFLKPSTSIVGPQEAIVCPPQSADVQHEAELGVVLGRALTRATAAEAKQAVFGWTCVNDVTARDIQREEKQFTRAKGFDTFCPVGPVVETTLDPMELTVIGRVNGKERQRGHVRDMKWDPYELLSFISHVMTLLPGDLVSTGTPEGVGRMDRGDWVEVEVPGIGILRNPVT
jgi:2-keto-4-pentenoate hydratase/2-oxohepta-3-ene-1,7-dioic acid hydratase in catechol pathway